MIPEYPSAPIQPADFKDRRTGLIIFGILSCLIGGFSALGALSLPFAIFASRMTPGSPTPDLRSLIVAGIIYLSFATLFIWIGIDSFRAKRWVRPIVLSLGWTWLIMGICGMGMLIFTAPQMAEVMSASATAQGGPPLPPTFATVVMVVMFVFSGLLYLALPIAYLLFYSGKNVRATLEHYDPNSSWTERVPVQILGLTVGLALAALAMLASMAYAVLPIFGTILVGLPAVIAFLVISAMFAFAAWLTYQRRLLGWWMTTILTIVLPISIIISMRRYTLAEIYAGAGLPPESLKMLEMYSSQGNLPSIVAMAILTLACIGYMLYVLKYFRTPAKEPVPFASRAVE